jgi:hypothetical protein
MGTMDSLFDGSDAHRMIEDALREQFEAWIKRDAPLACFDLGEDGDYIVLGMQDQFEAFCAGTMSPWRIGECLKLEADNASLQAESKKHYQMYWSVLKHESLVKAAARKILRVHGNGQPKQLDDAVLLLKVAMSEYDDD